ncbi:2-keto-4-pentenoate hydratase [Pararhizobium capsulatum DSM 1112]|uniref:2-keto-4-pentenoate hydratase n=1 Tax=Pararhizobium capsulatum DSM 1112 TaxID=1121113 RepID=A0ABU0BXD1_9HYPH|nr:fumarylacetoacetate hydrolase family protein [Pararhizobium capsulatum]MDQ0322918.1 2-keto-4-pentenoate hydratase [Pararhizobium capsulatum DSM 1112]
MPGRLAQNLFLLRAGNRAEPTAEFQAPAGLAEAMEVQMALADLEGANHEAWKVAISPDGYAVAALLHPFLEAADSSLSMGANPKLEVELAVRLGKRLPIRAQPYVRAEILSAISDIFLGIELVSSAVEEGGKLSFPLFLADRLGNRGYVLGPPTGKELLNTVGELDLYIELNDKPLFDGRSHHPVDDPLTWLLGYANASGRAETSLKAGTVITTGSLCGAIPIAEPGRISVHLGDELSMSVILR